MKRTSVLLLAALLGALGSASCTSTVSFQGTRVIPINGEARAPRLSKRALKAQLKNKQIIISEKVQFEVNQAVIKPESFPLLNDVATVIKENPQLLRVNIEGHASSDGDPASNLSLSDRRAKAVMDYLMRQGIEPQRLYGEGFGDKRPLADNNTQDGREKNRRVEFHTEDTPRVVPTDHTHHTHPVTDPHNPRK